MERLHAYLKDFIAKQITTDRLWRRIDVIYSGHDVSWLVLLLLFFVGIPTKRPSSDSLKRYDALLESRC